MSKPGTSMTTAPAEMRAQRMDPIHWLRGEVDRLFEDFGGRPGRLFDWPMLRPSWPAIEVKDDARQVHIAADVPGFDAKDIKVTLDGDQVVIRGARSDAIDREDDGVVVSERHQGSFERRIMLPERVKPDGVKAKLRHGVLKLTFDKTDTPVGTSIPVEMAD
jgi:HSP20 family protein